MAVVIKCDGALNNELFMLELQGTIVARGNGEFDGKKLGKLKEIGKGKYELFIGNHVLVGKSEKLNKPLIMAYPSEKVEGFMGRDELRSSICNVRGIVREKIVFKTRPNIFVDDSPSEPEETDGTEIDRERMRT